MRTLTKSLCLLLLMPASVTAQNFITDVTITVESPDIELIDNDTNATDWEICVDNNGCFTRTGLTDAPLESFNIAWSDGTPSGRPFVIQTGAPTNTLFLDSQGDLGLGTSTPGGTFGANLHIADTFPGIVFDDNVGTTQMWSLFGFDSVFTIRDETVTGGRVFSLEAGAPVNSFFMDSNGRVGIGTASPLHRLFVTGTDPGTSEIQIQVRNESATTTTRQLLGFVNNGPPQIAFTDTSFSPARSWLISNSITGNFIIKLGGFAGNNFLMDTSGNITITGTLTQNSSREVKEQLGSVDLQEVLDKVVSMPVTTWKYDLDEGDIRHMGPMSEDFYAAFGLGKDDKGLSTVDTAGVAFASIQGLHQLVKEKDEKIQKIETELAELKDMVQALAESRDR